MTKREQYKIVIAVLRCFALTVIAHLTTTIHAQELELKSFYEATDEVMTVPMQKRDLNGEICALVKVQLPVEGCGFKGNVFGTPEFDINEYLVYMTKGSKQLQVQCPKSRTMAIDFNRYGVPELQSKRVYKLVLEVPGTSIDGELEKALKPAIEMYNNEDYERAHQEFQKIKDTWADRGWTNAGLDDWLNRCVVAQTFKRLGVTTYYPKKEGMYRVSSEKGYGFVDSIGNVVVEPQYYDARDFEDGVADVGVKVETILQSNPKLAKEIQRWDAHHRYGGISDLIGGVGGLIDKSGTIVVSPHFQYISSFSNGFAWVQDWNDKWGVINKSGNYIIKPQYQCVMNEEGTRYCAVATKWGSYKEEWGVVHHHTFGENYTHWGLVDALTGKTVLSCKYLGCYETNAYYCFIDKERKPLFIDKHTGNEKFKLSSEIKFVCPFENGHALVSRGGSFRGGYFIGTYGIIDGDGREILSPNYKDIRYFSHITYPNLLVVERYTDKNNIALFNCEDYTFKEIDVGEYYFINFVNLGYAPMGALRLKEDYRKDADKYFCIIDPTTGKRISPLVPYTAGNDVYGARDKYSPVVLKEGNKYTLYDMDGNIYNVPRTSITPEFWRGRARIQQDGKYGYIDAKGNIVIPCKYSYATHFLNDYATVAEENGARMKIDADGNEIIQ